MRLWSSAAVHYSRQGPPCISSSKWEAFESFQPSPLGRGSDRDTNHSLEGGSHGHSQAVSDLHSYQPTSTLQHFDDYSSLSRTDAFKCNGLNQETRVLRSKTKGRMCSNSDTVNKEAQSWMKICVCETWSILHCLYTMNCRVYYRHKMIIEYN